MLIKRWNENQSLPPHLADAHEGRHQLGRGEGAVGGQLFAVVHVVHALLEPGNEVEGEVGRLLYEYVSWKERRKEVLIEETSVQGEASGRIVHSWVDFGSGWDWEILLHRSRLRSDVDFRNTNSKPTQHADATPCHSVVQRIKRNSAKVQLKSGELSAATKVLSKQSSKRLSVTQSSARTSLTVRIQIACNI